MKNFYDKLILALAVLVLLGGAALYVLKSDTAVDSSAGAPRQPADNPYEAIPIPDSTAKSANWPEPEHQSSGPNWVYDVFTPPKIYLDREGNFTAEPPKPPAPPEPFGIYLAEISRKLYRIQIQGFSGDRTKPKECVLFLFDEEREIRFFIRPGQENTEADVEVLDFVINREIDAEKGTASVTAITKILDKRTGEEIKLVDGERRFDEETSIVFRSEEDPSVKVELSIDELPEEGLSFKTPAGEYLIQEINLEEESVTVKKEATEETEAVTRRLSPTVFNKPEATQPTEQAPETPIDESDFGSFFN